MSKYERFNHAKTFLRYHLIFSTKYRRKCLNPIRDDLKQQSTYLMWQQHHDYLAKFYWSGQHHLWTRGYFTSTIGGVSEKTLVEYIKNQG